MALDQRHHEVQLQSRLDELYLTGHCFIVWNEIYHWFNLDKIAKAPYRKINEMWEELCERHGLDVPPLTVREGGGGIRLFRPLMAPVDLNEKSLADMI